MNQSTQERHFSYILGILTFNIIMQIGSFGSAMDFLFPVEFSVFFVLRIFVLLTSIVYASMICLKGRYPSQLFFIPVVIMMFSPFFFYLEIFLLNPDITFNEMIPMLIPQFLIWIEFCLITWVMVSKRIHTDAAITVVLAIIVYNLFMGGLQLLSTRQMTELGMQDIVLRLIIGQALAIMGKLLIYVALIWNISDEKKISSEELIS